MKYLSALVSGLLITGILLWLMNLLIAKETNKVAARPQVRVEVTALSPIKEDQPPRPVEPQPPAVAPSADQSGLRLQESQQDTDDIPGLQTPPLELTAMELPSGAPALEDGLANSGAMPMYRVPPHYPPTAALNGIEGWVLLRYDVDKSGALSNIRVIDARPRQTFDQEAIRALKKWKFKPAMDNGVAVDSKGQTVKIEFNLDQQ